MAPVIAQMSPASQRGRVNFSNTLSKPKSSFAGHVPNDLMREYYEQRATAGLIKRRYLVSEDAQGWLGAPGIYNREQRAGWKAITDAVHAKGGRIFAQLWHQGAVSHPSFFHDGRLPLAPKATTAPLATGSQQVKDRVKDGAQGRSCVAAHPPGRYGAIQAQAASLRSVS